MHIFVIIINLEFTECQREKNVAEKKHSLSPQEI